MKKYQYILLDLDGTLTDPAQGITNSICHALKHWGMEESDRNKLYRFIGPPLKQSFINYYNFSPAQAEEAVAQYREYFSVKGIFENLLYPGIPELLQTLCEQKKRVILATSKPHIFARRILEHFDLLPYFTEISGSELDGSRVEKAEVISYALSQAGVEKGEYTSVVMVGDRSYDMDGAEKNGIDSVAVLYGYGSKEELAGARPTFMAETVTELSRILCGDM